ncbi:MAG: hypothetical protein K2L22_00340 [Muribaculaceae bacterium]|nr:hypothetical protein [Muribaculaceae bacterium]
MEHKTFKVLLLKISTFASTPKMLVAYFSRAGENWQVGNVERGNTAIMGDYLTPKRY